MQPRKDIATWFGFPLSFFSPFKRPYITATVSHCSHTVMKGIIGCQTAHFMEKSVQSWLGISTLAATLQQKKLSYSWTVIIVLPSKFWQSFPLQPLSLTELLCSISSAPFPNYFANRIGNIYLDFVPLNKQLLQKTHTILCCVAYFITVSAVNL